MTPIKLLAVLILATACGGAAPSSQLEDVQADDLWAGLTTYTFSRYVSDHCQDPIALDTNPARYSDWVRQRAGYRRVCFQIWKPGVTDVDNPNYWRELDVQVHYRTPHGWQKEYVNMVDRQGNNLRYSWELTYLRDPFYPYPSKGMLRHIWGDMVEDQGNGRMTVRVPFYFTVNGKELKASNGEPFAILYEGYVREFRLESGRGAMVLHPDLTCDGLTVGSGAGHFAIDVTDVAAAANLKRDLLAQERFGGRHFVSETDVGEILSFTFSSRNNTPASIHEYTEGFGFISVLKIEVAGDRATLQTLIRYEGEELVDSQASFENCQIVDD